MGNFLSKAFGGTDPKIMSKTFVDPLKQAVATPYSKFLAEKVGQGLPQYEGDLTPDMSQEGQNAYSNFMGMDAGEWFDKSIGDKATQDFQENILPGVEEGYAGALRGSGRYRDVEDYSNRFSQDLASTKSQAVLDITKAQVDTGFKEWGVRQQQAAMEYESWYKTLPENNPMLDKALQFLSEGTSTGTDVVTFLDPGKKGWLGDVISSVAVGAIAIAAAPATGGASLAAGAGAMAGV